MSSVTSDLEAAIDALYQGPREAFVRARNALAERCTVAGDLPGGQRVRGLPKPSVTAWAINQLWWRHRGAYDELHAAGAELAALQREGSAVAGQPANAARRAALGRLRTAAKDLLAEAGHAASAATMRRITASLEASAAGGSFGSDARLGRLHADLEPPGFGQVLGFAAPPPARATGPADAATQARRTAVRRDHERALAALDDASAVLRSAEASDADAQDALRRAAATAESARDALERARARAALAEQRAVQTRAALEEPSSRDDPPAGSG